MSHHQSSTEPPMGTVDLTSPPPSPRQANNPVTPPPNAYIWSGTPISSKTSGNSYASETVERKSANLRLAHETSGLFLGAMPPQQFLERFLPIGSDTPQCPNSEGAFASVLSANIGNDMYMPFVSRVLCFCTYYALPTSL